MERVAYDYFLSFINHMLEQVSTCYIDLVSCSGDVNRCTSSTVEDLGWCIAKINNALLNKAGINNLYLFQWTKHYRLFSGCFRKNLVRMSNFTK